MRFVVVLALFAACDLQPPKRNAAADNRPVAATPPPAAPADAAVAVPLVAPDDGPGAQRSVDAMESSDACVAVADHIVTLLIDGIEDETRKAQQIQDRARTVKRIADACTRDKWPEASQKCFLDGKTSKEIEPCGRALAAPKPQ